MEKQEDFKVGDIVQLIPEEVVHLPNTRRHIGVDLIVKRIIQEIVYTATVVDDIALIGMKPRRFKKVNPVKKEEPPMNIEIKAGAILHLKDLPNHEVLVSSVDRRGLVHLKGSTGAWRKDRFIEYVKPAEEQKAPVKPVVKEKTAEEKLIEELDKLVGGNPKTASYGAIRKDGTFYMNVRDACHARMVGTAAIAVANHIGAYHKKHKDPETYKKYVKYIVFESPFKGCFKEGQDIETIINSSVLMNVDKTPNEIITAAVALRHGSEYTAHLNTFKTLIEHGFSGSIAFFASCFADNFSNGGNHQCMTHVMDFYDAVATFGERGLIVDPAQQPLKVSGSDYRIFNTIAKNASHAGEKQVPVENQISYVLKKGLKGFTEVKRDAWGGDSARVTGANGVIALGAFLARYIK